MALQYRWPNVTFVRLFPKKKREEKSHTQKIHHIHNHFAMLHLERKVEPCQIKNLSDKNQQQNFQFRCQFVVVIYLPSLPEFMASDDGWLTVLFSSVDGLVLAGSSSSANISTWIWSPYGSSQYRGHTRIPTIRKEFFLPIQIKIPFT